MVDIETLDTGPSSIVLSLAAVQFDAATGEPGRRLVLHPDLHEQILAERTMSADTLLFWTKQGGTDAFRDAFRGDGRRGVGDCLAALYDFLIPAHGGVWARSPSFDLVILESMYLKWRSPLGWKYWQTRDVRTIMDAAGIHHNWRPANWAGVAHSPVDDCLLQIAQVTEARREIS